MSYNIRTKEAFIKFMMEPWPERWSHDVTQIDRDEDRNKVILLTAILCKLLIETSLDELKVEYDL